MGRLIPALLAVALFLAVPGLAWAQEKVCTKCNKTYGIDSRFCLDDGTPLVAIEKCPKCRNTRASKSRYCASCGYDFEKPATPTCAKCNKTSPPGTRFCTNCGAAMPSSTGGGSGTPAGTGTPAGGGAEQRQWVEAVTAASSQYGIRLFAKEQVVGAPDVQRPGQDGRAWCPSMARRGIETLTVQFAKAGVPSLIRIYEPAAQGFVTRVDAVVDGRDVPVWEGQDLTKLQNPILEITPRAGAPRANVYKITIDTNKVRGWTEIDAVELVIGAGGSTTQAGTDVGGGNDDAAEDVIGSGPLAISVGSVLTYVVTRGRQTETLEFEVHLISDRSIGLAWSASGDRETAGYVQIRRDNLDHGLAYDDLFPDEQADTLEEATAVWVPRHVLSELTTGNRSRLDIAGTGQISLSGANRLAQNVTVDSKGTRANVVSSYLAGGGKLTLLDDPENPLVMDMERNGFRMTLQALEGVGATAPAGTGASGTGGTTSTKPPAVPDGTGAGTPTPAKPTLPVYDTPDACFEAWKAAVIAGDAEKLAQCYVATERRSIADSGEVASGIFDRYKESLEKSKFSIESKKEVGSQTVWVMEVRVREIFWTRKAKETIKFTREDGSYRLAIERDGF